MGIVNVDWGVYENSYVGADGIQLFINDPVPFFKYYKENKSSDHRKCPAYNNYFKNTFVVCSPIDLEVVINKDESWCNVVTPQDFPKQLFTPRFKEANESPYPIFSIAHNLIVTMCKEKDVFVEQLEPTLEWDRDPNIRIINGTFNIHRWTRPLDIAFEQRFKNIVVKFKKDQPMYYLRFVTNDPEDTIVLKKVELSIETQKDVAMCLGAKNYSRNKPLNYLYEVRRKFLASLGKK